MFKDSTLLHCEFLSASYSAFLNYTNGAQTITVSSDATAPLIPVDCVTGPMSISDGGLPEMQNKSCSTLNLVGEGCTFDPSVLRTLAYQGVADAFGRLVKGSIGQGGLYQCYPVPSFNTNVANTVLMDTDEMSVFQNWSLGDNHLDLAALSKTSNGMDYAGLFNSADIVTRGSLSTTLEMLFQTMTLSLLSEQYLQ